MAAPRNPSPAPPVSAWLSNANGGRELAHHAAPCSRCGTQVRASFAAPHGGARAAPHALRRACLRERRRRTPRSHLTRAPARPASSVGLAASARHKRLGAAAGRCGARMPQQAARQPRPPLPCRLALPTHSLLRRARDCGRRHPAGFTCIRQLPRLAAARMFCARVSLNRDCAYLALP